MIRDEALKIAKPILFNTEMVRAIQDKRKTATRRVVKPQPEDINDIIYKHTCGQWFISPDDDNVPETEIKLPYKVGDILYVRETWFYEEHMHDITAGEPDLPSGRYSFRYVYKAEYPDYPVNVGVGADGWRPSIHMPKEAARIFLRVTDVRVERLQNMTFDDFLSEGIVLRPEAFNDPDNAYYQAKEQYEVLWNSTVKKSDLEKYGWAANPWVWVIEFERLEVET